MFEVASVKPSAPDDIGRHAARDWGETDGRVRLRHVTIPYVLMHTKNLLPEQISGPGWLDTQFFDIQGIAPAGTPKNRIPLMLQSLLEDRFKMKFHREPSTVPVYALVVAKDGPKLTQTNPVDGLVKDSGFHAGEGKNRRTVIVGKGPLGKYTSTMTDEATHTEFEDMSMSGLARYLSQPGMLEVRVVDMTGLPGVYRVTVDVPRVSPGNARGPGQALTPAGVSLSGSLRKMGLKLVKRKTPSEKFVIDSIEKSPTPN
jgi:uncharacterized protein (TIGR03435 family)